MTTPQLPQWTPTPQIPVKQTVGRLAEVPLAYRRVSRRGARPWSMPAADRTLRQPQDGAQETSARIAAITTHLHDGLLREPEDARLTGGTRSLMRRLLGLNITSYVRKVQESAMLPAERASVA